jgi:hypothetical protein
MKTGNKLKDTQVYLTGNPKSDTREVRGKSIGGDLDVDDECSEQHRFEPVQSLHHGSVGYQSVRTRIGLGKKAMSLQVN